MVKRILVGLDGSTLAEAALPYVRLVAPRFGAEVTLVQVVALPNDADRADPRDLQEFFGRGEAQAHQYLQRMAKTLQDDGIAVRREVVFGDAAREIVGLADARRVDLIALATHGRSGVEHAVYGSVAERVLRSTKTPVLMAHALRPWSVPSEGIQQIVVPLDGSAYAEAVLSVVKTLATALKVPVTLLRVVDMVYTVGEPSADSAEYRSRLDALKEGAAHYLTSVSAELQYTGLVVSAAIKVGFPAAQIEDFVVAHPGSLVLMTTHTGAGYAEHVGSVS